MQNSLFRKGLVVGIIVLFIGMSLLPGIYAKTNIKNQDISTVTLFAIGETWGKENKIEIPTEDAENILNQFNKLKQEITQDPYSDKAVILRNDFVSLLDEKGMLPQGISKDDFISLLSPPDTKKTYQDNLFFNRIFNLIRTIRNPLFNRVIQLFENSFKNINPPVESFDASASLNFCTIASYGDGYTIPVMIPPRPRIGITWSANYSETYAGEVFSNKAIYAEGKQSGSTIGFTGGGGTFAFPGVKFYVFVGYTWHIKVSAEHIDFYPPNQPPEVSDENPINGEEEVPISLSELSFRISDQDGDSMDYIVTTEPDIGTGSGNNKGNGIYSVPVFGLENNKIYTWIVEVTDGNFIINKKFTFFTPIAPFDPFDEGWQYRKKITINHNMVTGSLSDYPVLISYSDSDLKNKAQGDGDDILFMDDKGEANQLFHEIESFDCSNGELVAWINIPALSSSIDIEFYMYYGNPDCGSHQLPESVWDSNYIMVQHMDIKDSTIYDSTLNGNDGYLVSSPYNIDGVISNAVQFDGIDDAIEVPYDSTLESPELTFELWGRITGSRSDGKPHNYFALKRGRDHWGNNDGHQFSFHGYWHSESGTRRFRALYERNSAPQQHAVGDSAGLNNTWYYFSTTFDEDTYNAKFYMNGSLKATEPMESEVIWYNDNSGFSWAKDYRPTPLYMHVSVDETRISSVVRSAEWISTQFNNQNDPSSFFSVGPEET